jgi:hypothetical protein
MYFFDSSGQESNHFIIDSVAELKLKFDANCKQVNPPSTNIGRVGF